MKLVKLSLVAAMAAGVFATTASAVPLEEAIKDVDLSGYTRVRYTNDSVDNGKTTDGTSQWAFRGILNFKAKIDDNFFTVVGLRYDERDTGESKSGIDGRDAGKANLNKQGDIEIYQAYFGYKIAGTTVTLGRQVVGAFFTDDMYGDGIKVTNTDIQGLTLAAMWMDSLEEDPEFNTKYTVGADNKRLIDNDLYSVAAIGSYDPVSFQLWYASLVDVGDLFAVELATSFDVTDDVNLGLKGQYAFADIDNNYKAVGVDDSDFYGIQASANLFGVDFRAGYVDFSTDRGKTSITSVEDDGKFIKAGEELIDYQEYTGENSYGFVAAGYTIPNTGVRVGVDYLNGEGDGANGIDQNMEEVVARVEYAHNKKLKFQTWYSHMEDDRDVKGYEKDRFRFEARYNF